MPRRRAARAAKTEVWGGYGDLRDIAVVEAAVVDEDEGDEAGMTADCGSYGEVLSSSETFDSGAGDAASREAKLDREALRYWLNASCGVSSQRKYRAELLSALSAVRVAVAAGGESWEKLEALVKSRSISEVARGQNWFLVAF